VYADRIHRRRQRSEAKLPESISEGFTDRTATVVTLESYQNIRSGRATFYKAHLTVNLHRRRLRASLYLSDTDEMTESYCEDAKQQQPCSLYHGVCLLEAYAGLNDAA
jgi:hypothetical protein